MTWICRGLVTRAWWVRGHVLWVLMWLIWGAGGGEVSEEGDDSEEREMKVAFRSESRFRRPVGQKPQRRSESGQGGLP